MLRDREKRLYRARAGIIRALAHPLRLEMLEVLSKGERCVSDIAKNVGSERSSASRHLAVLAKADLVNTRKDGLNIYYSLKCPCVVDFFACVEQVLKEQLNEKIRLLKK
jgi:ArsR family transcriptional regulator